MILSKHLVQKIRQKIRRQSKFDKAAFRNVMG